MKKTGLSVLTFIVSFFSITPLCAQTIAPVAEAKWVCTAPNMVSGRYTGGDWAFIHLAAYQSGGSYKIVEKSDTAVKGVTKDGTSFECKKSP